MGDYSKEALGQVVRGLRERKGVTQERLGREAGYGTGAGVSISRLESGVLNPRRERLAGIARALGLKLEELEDRVATHAAHDEASTADDGTPSRSSKDLNDRVRRVQHEIGERTTVITSLGEEFNRQHDRAREEFFMRLVDVAARVEGARQPDPTHFEGDDATDPDAVAAFRLRSNANGIGNLLAGGAGGAAAGAAVGGAAAYGTFVAAATFGTASTGAAISGLSGVAATNATLALLGGGTLAAGGAGVAGGTILLASIVAAPMVVLFAGGLVWMARRNRKQQEELATQLDEAEAQLDATAPGFRALENILPRASETLDYIATHGGHALSRWEEQLGSGSMTWESLGEADQQRYQGFVEIAAAQLTIVTINVQGLLTTEGNDRDELIQLADKLLKQSDKAVRSQV
ncbi:MAG TPA: helix-turn-helix transcriptional regulator [Gaiellaceae bacterium]|nr:helix-turn-helix transcriptional regulator [Gaiellaceae bacterium]